MTFACNKNRTKEIFQFNPTRTHKKHNSLLVVARARGRAASASRRRRAAAGKYSRRKTASTSTRARATAAAGATAAAHATAARARRVAARARAARRTVAFAAAACLSVLLVAALHGVARARALAAPVGRNLAKAARLQTLIDGIAPKAYFADKRHQKPLAQRSVELVQQVKLVLLVQVAVARVRREVGIGEWRVVRVARVQIHAAVAHKHLKAKLARRQNNARRGRESLARCQSFDDTRHGNVSKNEPHDASIRAGDTLDHARDCLRRIGIGNAVRQRLRIDRRRRNLGIGARNQTIQKSKHHATVDHGTLCSNVVRGRQTEKV